MLILIPLSIKAEEYDVKSANMKITFPDDWYVFTRENVENNKNLEAVEVDAEYMNKFFNSNSAYIDAIKSGTEFVLRTSENVDFASLSDYPDEKVEEVASDMGAINKTKDYKVYTNKYKYIVFTNKLGDYYMNVYSTVINSKWYTYTIQKKSDFTADEVTETRKIIDSIDYTIVEAPPEEKKEEPKKKDDKKFKSKLKLIAIYSSIVVLAGALVGFVIYKKRGKES